MVLVSVSQQTERDTVMVIGRERYPAGGGRSFNCLSYVYQLTIPICRYIK